MADATRGREVLNYKYAEGGPKGPPFRAHYVVGQLSSKSNNIHKSAVAASAGVFAAFLGSLCCIGPILLVTIGIGAGLATTLEPLRPVFGVIMLLMFGVAFYSVYGKRVTAGDAGLEGQACVHASRRDKAFLWAGAIVAIVMWSFPTWSTWLL